MGSMTKTAKAQVTDVSLLRGPLLDIGAVAEALGVTPRHIQRLVSERRIPFLKVGRFVRFDPAARPERLARAAARGAGAVNTPPPRTLAVGWRGHPGGLERSLWRPFRRRSPSVRAHARHP